VLQLRALRVPRPTYNESKALPLIAVTPEYPSAGKLRNQICPESGLSDLAKSGLDGLSIRGASR